MIVICCTIAMFDEVREWNRENNKGYVEVFLNVPFDTLKQRDQKSMYSKYERGEFENLFGMEMEVEFPKCPDIEIINDGQFTIEECVRKIMDYPVTISSDFDRDTEYWNQFYQKNPDIHAPFFICTRKHAI